jgi:hypothetical protein
MSLVLDFDGNLYNYNIVNDKLSMIPDCDIRFKKIINLRSFSYALSTDGRLYSVNYMSTTIDDMEFNYIVSDFVIEHKSSSVYALSSDNILHKLTLVSNQIITDYKFIKIASLEAAPNTSYASYVQFVVFITDQNVVMYRNNNNFVEFDLISELNYGKKIRHISTRSISENLRLLGDKFMFCYGDVQFYYDPNKIVYKLPGLSTKIITKCFELSDRDTTHNIYGDANNNKYIIKSIPSKNIELTLLSDFDVNLPKIIRTKSSRNVFDN